MADIKTIQKKLNEMDQALRNESSLMQEDARRRIIVESAEHEADTVITEFSNGSVEETNYLTFMVAMKLLNHIQCSLSGAVLKYDLIAKG